VRDPRDVVLSCLQQRFGMNAAMYQFLSVESAAHYYNQVMTLGARARELYDFALRDVRYDDMVNDLEQEARSTIAFLGLDWDNEVLAYRERLQMRTINTPSDTQVVEPIYTRSLGKWRNYEAHLAPVMDILTPWVERLGYADNSE